MLRSPIGRMLSASIAIAYAFASMLEGQMLLFFRTGQSPTLVEILPSGGAAWWNYPALLVVAPNAVLVLPFFATIVMLLVSVGVGLGMTVAVLLGIRLFRRRASGAGRSTAAGSVAGVTPVMIGLVTLGACCSTTAAATAGIGVVAQASGTSVGTLLSNDWYLGVFQLGVLFVALVAQEQLVRIYGTLFAPEGANPAAEPAPAPFDGRYAAGGLLRVGLVVGGSLGALTMFSEWIATPPAAASAVLWFQWLGQHELVSIFALSAGLAPAAFLSRLGEIRAGRAGLLLRGGLLATGATLLAWFPATVVSAGLHGLPNELLGAAGAPIGLGAVAPGATGAIALALRWLLEFGLLGAFSVAFAVAPERALTPLSWTLPRPRVESPGGLEPPVRSPGPTAAAVGPSPEP